MRKELEGTARTVYAVDERGRVSRSSTRQDYVGHLISIGEIASSDGLFDRPDLCEFIYLDWLNRGQVGCIFAQLLSRTNVRSPLIQTTVLLDPIRTQSDCQLR